MSGLAAVVLVCAFAGAPPALQQAQLPQTAPHTPVAPADPQPTLVAVHERAMDDARAAFNRFDLTAAELGFAAAVANAPSSSQRALALVWLGAVRAENGDFDGARARFHNAVALDVGVVVPDHLSPTIQQLVDEARAAARARAVVTAPVTAPAPGDEVLPAKPRWTLLSGGAVAALGVLAVGGGAMVGMQAITQRDVAQSLAFQSDAVDEYKKAREGAMWSNVLYGAGGVLVATGSTLAVASLLGADGP